MDFSVTQVQTLAVVELMEDFRKRVQSLTTTQVGVTPRGVSLSILTKLKTPKNVNFNIN